MASPTRPRPSWFALPAILLLSLLVKLAFALNVDQLAPRNDEWAYLELAAGILDRGTYDSLFRPPGYPVFLAALLKLGATLEGLRVVQTLLSSLSVLLVWWITRSAFGSRVALVAAALVAFDPVLIAFSHLLWSETLYIFFVLAVIAVAGPRVAPASLWHWLVAGILLGLAGLTRPVILSAAPLVVLLHVGMGWRGERTWSGAWRQWMRPMVVFACGACLVVLPWSARNLRATGEFVLVDTNGAFNLLLGTEPDAMFVDKDDAWSPRWARIDGVPYPELADRQPGYAQRRALWFGTRHVAEDPMRYLGAVAFEGGHFWTLDNFALRHLRNGWYGPDVPTAIVPVAVGSSLLFGILILGGGCLGLVALPPGRLQSAILLLVLHSAVLHALLFSLSRYQVSLRPLLAIPAAWFLAAPRERLGSLWAGSRPTWRGWVAGLVLVALLVVWARDLPLLGDMLRTGGENFRFVRRG